MTPAGIYSGTVFQDFNSNGTRDLTTTIPNVGAESIAVAFDRGIEGITVSAFNTAGGAEGSTATLADGSFSFTPTGSGPYRFEFSNLPVGFFSGPDGTDSHSTVQFVADGGASNLNLGVVRPTDYSSNNPLLVTNQYVFGDSATQSPNATALLSFPYAAGGGTTNPGYALPAAPHEIQIPADRIGSTWGLGWDQFGRDIYAAAYFKRHAGFGPDGTGAIYQIPVPATLPPAPYAPPPGSLLYVDLNAVFGANTAGPNQHDTVDDGAIGLEDDYDTDNGDTGWDAVGKTSLGGLDVSDDGQFIFAMNLFDRQLYRIPTSGTLDNATIQRVSIPLANPNPAIIAPGTFNSDDLRPFAVEYHNGQLYVGVVYSAETTDNRDELLALVYRVDPVTRTFSAAPVFQAGLNYIRSQSTIGNVEPGLPSTWEPWEAAYFSNAADLARAVAPQPMFSGLSFDPEGNMVLGIRDRGADQTGFFQLSNPSNGTRVEGFTAGDILRAFVNTPNDLNSGWTLEDNARGPGGIGSGPQGNLSGPNGGEFYFEENYGISHGETAMGGILQLPGFPDVALTNMDPGVDFRAGGISWFNNLTGAETKAYEVYQNVFNPLPFEPTFSQANGLGDLIALSELAPIEIGDRVWLDRNGNGVQDAGEEGIEGVVVDLLDNVGGFIDSATTDVDGNYSFSSGIGTTTARSRYGLAELQPGQDFTLRILNAEGGAQQTDLLGRRLTTADVVSGPGSDFRDSDGTLVGDDATFDFTTGTPGSNDHTFDFGFQFTFGLGNRVWNDADNSGTINGAEVGINGVTVNLYRDSNDDGIADGVAIGTTATAGGGYYRFDGLIADTYIVEVDTTSAPLIGLLSSSVNAGDPDVDLDDSDDNGVVIGIGFVRSNPVTLGPGTSEPTTEADLGPGDAAEPNGLTNLTVDFGFIGSASQSNFVWEDLNGNGIQDGGEPGIDGVTVNLLGAGPDGNFGTADDIADSTITAGGGLYLFPLLEPGSYRLTFVAPVGYAITAQNQGADDATDSDADPITGETAVSILAVGELDDTWDTGMYRPVTFGDFVWEDLNGNGIYDGEPGVSNVTVNLLGAGPDGTFGTIDDVTDSTLTDGIGGYLFTGLAPGLFRVTFVAPAGFAITAQNQGIFEALDSDADPVTGQTDSFTLPSNTSDVDWDAGIYQPASVGDRLWYDVNGDGVQDAGEPGINGATVILDYAGPDGLFGTGDDQIGLATEPTVTDGNYLFDNLAPGNYRVRVDSATLPNGLTDPTFDLDLIATPNVASFALGSNEDRVDVDFGYRGTASLGDRVWYDLDGDTVQDALETGLNGVNVQLTWAGSDGTFGTADDLASTQLTAGDGNYLFNNLPAGNFRVNVLSGVPLNYSPTFDLDGIATPNVASTTLIAAQARTDVDFGYADRSSISGFVYVDLDNDGVRDPGEKAISQVDILLTGTDINNNPVNIATTTSATGFYTFPNLIAGTYTIRELQPRVVLDGKDTPGTPALGGMLTNDRFGNLVLPAGTSAVNYNFGELPLTTSISGNVYLDKNNNGIKDPGEAGIGGVAVYLRGTNDLGVAVSKGVVTDSQGRYTFLQLRPGLYRVVEAHPAGFVDGKDTAGNLLGVVTNDAIREITIQAGNQGVGYNFGERKAPAKVVLSLRLWINVGSGSSSSSVSALIPGTGKKIVNLAGAGDGVIEP